MSPGQEDHARGERGPHTMVTPAPRRPAYLLEVSMAMMETPPKVVDPYLQKKELLKFEILSIDWYP